jgi:hypothetical protein
MASCWSRGKRAIEGIGAEQVTSRMLRGIQDAYSQRKPPRHTERGHIWVGIRRVMTSGRSRTRANEQKIDEEQQSEGNTIRKIELGHRKTRVGGPRQSGQLLARAVQSEGLVLKRRIERGTKERMLTRKNRKIGREWSGRATIKLDEKGADFFEVITYHAASFGEGTVLTDA